MPKLMMNLQWTGRRERPPTLVEIQKMFGLTDKDVDVSFGVVEVDPQAQVYTILVEESGAAKVRSNNEVKVEGPFSNPRIDTFGPPQ